MNKLEIHTRLKEARKILNLNQLVIATDLGIQQKTISEIENGKILNIPNTYIYYFYQKGISLEWIYENKGPMLLEGANSISNSEKKSQTSVFNTLFDNFNQAESEIDKLPEIKPKKEIQVTLNTDLFERLLDSKDFTIKSLLAYIQSVENNLEFIKGLLVAKK